MAYIHNRLDNQVFYRSAIVADQILSSLTTRFINAGPFQGQQWTSMSIPAMCHIITYVRYRRINVEDPDIIRVRAGAIAECLRPGLADTMYANEQQARDRVIGVARWITNNIQQIADLTTASAVNYRDTLDYLDTHPEFSVNRGEALPALAPILPGGADPTIGQALVIILHTSRYATEWIADYSLSCLAHLHISVAKQGNVTTRFVNKVRTGIMTNLQTEIDFSPALVATFWNAFRVGIDETNIEAIFNNWEQWIPAQALRMRLVVQQTALTGLVVLNTIGKAMMTHPDFDWDIVFQYFPQDSQNFASAVTEVGGNVYYGYRKELGNVASTKYKSLGWVAWKLLATVDGMTTLNGYKGWPRTIPFQAEITQMIDDFNAVRQANVIDPATRHHHTERVARVMDAINDPRAMNIYA